MLRNTVDSSSFVKVTFVGPSFLNRALCLDIYNITLLVESHVCGQRHNSVFSKRPREHGAAAPPLSLCVGHFGKLLEDGGSGWKESRTNPFNSNKYLTSKITAGMDGWIHHFMDLYGWMDPSLSSALQMKVTWRDKIRCSGPSLGESVEKGRGQQ